MLNVMETAAKASAPKPQSTKNAKADEERRRMEEWLASRISASQAAPVTEIVTITPILAALLLEKNPANRNVSAIAVERISRDIKGGRWEFNGEAIVVSKDGQLNDGQHRLRAVVETGMPIRTVMVIGPERASRMTLDTGIARTVGHFLKMEGYHDTNALGSVANLVWQYRERQQIGQGGSTRPTKAEALLALKYYGQDLTDSLSFVSRNGVGAICSKSILAFAHWAIWRSAGRHAADDFLEKLIDGTELKKDNPVLYCRNRLIEMRGSARVGEKAELILRAWNMYRRGDRAVRIPINGRKLPDLEK